MTKLSPLSDDLSDAVDTVRNGDAIYVSRTWPCGNRQPECPGTFVGTWWDDTPTAGGVSASGIRASEADQKARPYDINDNANVCGWVWFRLINQAVCHPTAAYWPSPGSTSPIDLAAYLADPGNYSRAFDVNNYLQIVGNDEVGGRAILWEYVSGWSSVNLNESDPDDSLMNIDNIYFGPPIPAPTELGVIGVAWMVPRSRRRTGQIDS